MSIRIGINGFGRMGRLALRAAWDWPDFEIVHVNEVKGGAACAAHLLEFDSVHGRWERDISEGGASLNVDGRQIGFTEHKSPGEVPWDELGVDIVIEASGKFRTTALLDPYFKRGVKKVIVAAPVKQGALNVVMGVNDYLYDPQTHHLLTAASCTTNCLAPVVKVLHEKIGIEHGIITTIHDATNTQVIVDAPHKDLRRARAAGLSMIPTTTGSATAITLIYPELKGKLNGHAVRVPLLTGSLTDAVFEMSREVSAAEVNQLFREAADTYLKGILGVEERPLVSIDFKGDPRSAIVDAPSTMVVDGTQLKVYAWYDNEMGYVHRMMELAAKVAASL
ncbi:ArsJ-associated glyceraldehyde-3-phosphate dehydrogenase [Geoalkalibacter halelectricus]|uniref:Glyceraldehyde-3-phosphate dehydrogenase n=1 Tax=Geoalkalibacter halelectricus TaxID=2847045 RepID=A0ABY5ZHR3_9BACT|nr:ArsJ-associated glyceraldehyde-3-phosphate dehydrogenase [Geoalkalibacter halelectricus]MDO3380191.1 ArsJ-associated glyceraldehyde-3-phosphate dehydrogenase [Geoalkalibacter halelectricus]UWZ78236.1 ArsJ-associated glyceraldehyde-3-phosphate dehydrogenase [Geoalkalibacter halelectricus]